VREECKLKVSENGVLRSISGPKRDEVTGECRKLHNDPYCSPSTVRFIKSRRMRWVGYVGRMGESLTIPLHRTGNVLDQGRPNFTTTVIWAGLRAARFKNHCQWYT